MEYLFAPDRFEMEGLVLRSYLPGDGAKLFEAVDASRDHLAPWMPWIDAYHGAEDGERYARETRGKYLAATNFGLAIFSPDESELRGGCGFHLREGGLDKRAAEMGMWIRASQAGKGLGTKALEALIRWGFTEWPWLRLTWHCDSRNLASRRVPEKAGMRLEGELRSHFEARDGTRRDTLCYAILKEEYDSCAVDRAGR
jgi:RimJ/RimL family protein N-acetyltransferase